MNIRLDCENCEAEGEVGDVGTAHELKTGHEERHGHEVTVET